MSDPLVCVNVNDVQLTALSKLLHGSPIDSDERAELLTLHIHMGRQVQEHRTDVARLLGDMGADALVQPSARDNGLDFAEGVR